MADRVTYKGTKLFVNGSPIHRVTAFGSTTSLNKEDMLEIGNTGIVEVFEDIPSIDISMDSNEVASMNTLNFLAGKQKTNTKIDFEKNLDNARCNVWATVDPNDGSGKSWTKYIEDAYMTNASYQFSVDGNFTENYSLVSDNSRWLLNGAEHIASRSGTVDALNDSGVDLEFNHVVTKVLTVYLNGERISSEDYTFNIVDGIGTSPYLVEILITKPDSVKIGDTIKVYVGVSNPNKLNESNPAQCEIWVADTVHPGAVRSGHAKFYIVDHKKEGNLRLITLEKAQSAGVDVSLDREELKQLGSDKVYARPLNIPLSLDVSLDITHADLAFFAMLCGKDIENVEDVKELNVRDLSNDLGLLVEVYKDGEHEREKETDTPEPNKIFYIEKLISTDEGFNINTDSNAAQTFSFRARNLVVGKTRVDVGFDSE